MKIMPRVKIDLDPVKQGKFSMEEKQLQHTEFRKLSRNICTHTVRGRFSRKDVERLIRNGLVHDSKSMLMQQINVVNNLSALKANRLQYLQSCSWFHDSQHNDASACNFCDQMQLWLTESLVLQRLDRLQLNLRALIS